MGRKLAQAQKTACGWKWDSVAASEFPETESGACLGFSLSRWYAAPVTGTREPGLGHESPRRQRNKEERGGQTGKDWHCLWERDSDGGVPLGVELREGGKPAGGIDGGQARCPVV